MILLEPRTPFLFWGSRRKSADVPCDSGIEEGKRNPDPEKKRHLKPLDLTYTS